MEKRTRTRRYDARDGPKKLYVGTLISFDSYSQLWDGIIAVGSLRSSQRPCRKWMAYLHFRHLYQVSSIQRHVQCILLSHTKNSNIRSPRSRVILATSVHGIAVPSCSRAFGMERGLIHVHVRSSAYQVRDILIR